MGGGGGGAACAIGLCGMGFCGTGLCGIEFCVRGAPARGTMRSEKPSASARVRKVTGRGLRITPLSKLLVDMEIHSGASADRRSNIAPSTGCFFLFSCVFWFLLSCLLCL